MDCVVKSERILLKGEGLIVKKLAGIVLAAKRE